MDELKKTEPDNMDSRNTAPSNIALTPSASDGSHGDALISELRRVDVQARSHYLMRSATWCGVVFALAVLLTILNLLPPVNVQYTIVSQVVVSEARLSTLHETVKSHKNKRPSRDEGCLSRIKVLDRSEGSPLLTVESPAAELVLVEIESEWLGRCPELEYIAWLKQLTQVSSGRLVESDAAKEVRMARWELETAQHYVAQHAFLLTQKTPEPSADRPTFQLASGGKKPVAATLATHVTAGNDPSGNAAIEDENAGELTLTPSHVGETLQQNVLHAERKLAESELAWQRQIEQSSGVMRATGEPAILPKTDYIPLWMAASVLILGLASGSTAGWLQHRLQSGGFHDPLQTANQLANGGLPQAGTIALGEEDVAAGTWTEATSRNARYARRQTGRHLTLVSEWVLGFWCILILVRVLADPLWRKVLIESPLAAFGRLFLGLP